MMQHAISRAISVPRLRPSLRTRSAKTFLASALFCLPAAASTTVGTDCNGNGVPDLDESLTLFEESFEAGLPGTWAASGLWHVTDQCAPTTPCDGASFAYFGLDGICDFSTEATERGVLTSPSISIPAASTSAELVYCSVYNAEGGDFDKATVLVNGTPVDVVSDAGSHDGWLTRTVDLTAFIGQQVTISFTFDSVDFMFNFNLGWQVDRVQVKAIGVDCNANGVPDVCDVHTGTSIDCNGNGLPDECEADCNFNGIPDDCDLTSGASLDCNANSVPDECELDCNANGIPDECDLATGTSTDCNVNGIPDECDTFFGTSPDCNSNSVPDECEIGGILMEESFEGGLPANWSASGLWHVTGQCARPTSCDGSAFAYFGSGATCTYDTGLGEAGALTAPTLWLPPTLVSADLYFCSAHEVEIGAFDRAMVTVNGAPVDVVSDSPPSLDWEMRHVDLTPFLGQAVTIRFEFDSLDHFHNDFLGWQIDRVRVETLSLVDCNANDVPDDCDISTGTSQDCNANGAPDECDIDAGTSFDCDGNGVPDECDPDCNNNGTPDACEGFVDCNSNSVPDECELAGNDCNSNSVPDECDTDCDANGTPDDCEAITDCNTNGVPDGCELVGNDCNQNGVPDECDPDCNANGTPDDCEAIIDCNTNGVPDECELAGNDCNTNGIPDECDTDCNTNGTPDDCESLADCNANGTPDVCESITDCNTNGVPDECELAGNDCNTNGIPDECDTDCNSNGTPDDCESITDCNTNGVPDECELAGNDCNSNGIPDECDTDCDSNGTPDDCEAFADCNANGIPDSCDIAAGTSQDSDGNGVPDECGPGAAYCFGDGNGTACPCGNTGGSGEGCANSSGAGGVVSASGSDSVAANDLVLHVSQLLPGQAVLAFTGTGGINGGNGNPFGDGLRCVSGQIKRMGVRIPNASGQASWGPGFVGAQGWSAGQTRTFQGWYRDSTGSPCGSAFNLTNGLRVVLTP